MRCRYRSEILWKIAHSECSCNTQKPKAFELRRKNNNEAVRATNNQRFNLHCSSQLTATDQVFRQLVSPTLRRDVDVFHCCHLTIKSTPKIDTINFVPTFPSQWRMQLLEFRKNVTKICRRRYISRFLLDRTPLPVEKWHASAIACLPELPHQIFSIHCVSMGTIFG